MIYFEWDKAFQLGLEQVDSEHHGLVDLVNRLGTSISETSVDYEALQILDDLANYAVTHFNNEEALMQQYGVDERHQNEHKLIHQHFVDDVIRMKKELKTGSQLITPKYLLNYLINWLSFHILVTDRNMANQIHEIDKGTSSIDAYDHQEKHFDKSVKPLISAVSGLFNQLAASNKELRELNETLETKVTERTAELNEANKKLETLSLTDMLTGLPNRRHALQQLQAHWDESMDNASPLSCMMIDADYFKVVNDELGHDSGDKVLITLARELRHSLRTDDFVARLGGDEFFVICPNTRLDGAIELAKAILSRVFSIKKAFPDLQWNSSVSIGISCKDKSQATVNELIKIADESVYMAKEAGRGCVRSTQST